MPTNIAQKQLNSIILKYIERVHAEVNPVLAAEIEDGHCAGWCRLFIRHCFYEDKLESFQKLLARIAANKITGFELEQVANQLLWLQHSDILVGVQYSNLKELFAKADFQFDAPLLELGLIYDKHELIEFLKNLEPDEVMLFSANGHATALYYTGLKYFYYDPNMSSKKEWEFDNVSEVADAIFYAHDKKAEKLSFSCESYARPKELVYKRLKEHYLYTHIYFELSFDFFASLQRKLPRDCPPVADYLVATLQCDTANYISLEIKLKNFLFENNIDSVTADMLLDKNEYGYFLVDASECEALKKKLRDNSVLVDEIQANEIISLSQLKSIFLKRISAVKQHYFDFKTYLNDKDEEELVELFWSTLTLPSGDAAILVLRKLKNMELGIDTRRIEARIHGKAYYGHIGENFLIKFLSEFRELFHKFGKECQSCLAIKLLQAGKEGLVLELFNEGIDALVPVEQELTKITASVLTAAIDYKNDAVVNAVLESPGLKPKQDKVGVLCAAAKRGDKALVEKLLEKKFVYKPNSLGETPLLLAVKYGHKDLVELFLEKRLANVVEADKQGFGVLAYAVQYADIDMLAFLLKKNAGYFESDKKLEEAFFIRLEKGGIDFIHYLLTEKNIKFKVFKKISADNIMRVLVSAYKKYDTIARSSFLTLALLLQSRCLIPLCRHVTLSGDLSLLTQIILSGNSSLENFDLKLFKEIFTKGFSCQYALDVINFFGISPSQDDLVKLFCSYAYKKGEKVSKELLLFLKSFDFDFFKPYEKNLSPFAFALKYHGAPAVLLLVQELDGDLRLASSEQVLQVLMLCFSLNRPDLAEKLVNTYFNVSLDFSKADSIVELLKMNVSEKFKECILKYLLTKTDFSEKEERWLNDLYAVAEKHKSTWFYRVMIAERYLSTSQYMNVILNCIEREDFEFLKSLIAEKDILLMKINGFLRAVNHDFYGFFTKLDEFVKTGRVDPHLICSLYLFCGNLTFSSLYKSLDIKQLTDSWCEMLFAEGLMQNIRVITNAVKLNGFKDELFYYLQRFVKESDEDVYSSLKAQLFFLALSFSESRWLSIKANVENDVAALALIKQCIKSQQETFAWFRAQELQLRDAFIAQGDVYSYQLTADLENQVFDSSDVSACLQLIKENGERLNAFKNKFKRLEKYCLEKWGVGIDRVPKLSPKVGKQSDQHGHFKDSQEQRLVDLSS